MRIRTHKHLLFSKSCHSGRSSYSASDSIDETVLYIYTLATGFDLSVLFPSSSHRQLHKMTSKDGFSWTKADGLRPGVPCIGAIEPPTNYHDANSKFDVIVVGAGYSGLTAARDASVAGMWR